MTVLNAQKALADELRILLSDYKLKGENDEMKSMSVFEDMVPHPSSEDDEFSFFPYTIVRAQSGKAVEESEEESTAKFLILIGVYDSEEKYPLNRDVLMLIQRIIERFSKNYILGGFYQRKGEIEWTISDEDVYPYCFGGLEINFTIPKIYKEDEFC